MKYSIVLRDLNCLIKLTFVLHLNKTLTGVLQKNTKKLDLSSKTVFPVQGSEAKNHTPYDTSPYRPEVLPDLQHTSDMSLFQAFNCFKIMPRTYSEICVIKTILKLQIKISGAKRRV